MTLLCLLLPLLSVWTVRFLPQFCYSTCTTFMDIVCKWIQRYVLMVLANEIKLK